MSNMPGEQGFGLQHATSLEHHIVQKIQNKLKVDESFFEYEKSLRFRNPLNRVQLVFVVLSIVYYIVYPVVYALGDYDGAKCQRYSQNLTKDSKGARATNLHDSGYQVGFGGFLIQFVLFIFLIDFQAILTRIYLFRIMNRKHHAKTEDQNYESQRE